jgi:hypothetical protein
MVYLRCERRLQPLYPSCHGFHLSTAGNPRYFGIDWSIVMKL